MICIKHKQDYICYTFGSFFRLVLILKMASWWIWWHLRRSHWVCLVIQIPKLHLKYKNVEDNQRKKEKAMCASIPKLKCEQIKCVILRIIKLVIAVLVFHCDLTQIAVCRRLFFSAFDMPHFLCVYASFPVHSWLFLCISAYWVRMAEPTTENREIRIYRSASWTRIHNAAKVLTR